MFITQGGLEERPGELGTRVGGRGGTQLEKERQDHPGASGLYTPAKASELSRSHHCSLGDRNMQNTFFPWVFQSLLSICKVLFACNSFRL